VPQPKGSRLWPAFYRLVYRILALIDPFLRRWWRRFGLGNVVEVAVARRSGPGDRARLLGVLHAGGRRYLGHPNGHVGWTRDLAEAGEGRMRYANGAEQSFTATLLDPGPEREQAIRATTQHPFPGNVVYRLGWRHIRAVGVFFRIEPVEAGPR
jgi:hypothetical protein